MMNMNAKEENSLAAAIRLLCDRLAPAPRDAQNPTPTDGVLQAEEDFRARKHECSDLVLEVQATVPEGTWPARFAVEIQRRVDERATKEQREWKVLFPHLVGGEPELRKLLEPKYLERYRNDLQEAERDGDDGRVREIRRKIERGDSKQGGLRLEVARQIAGLNHRFDRRPLHEVLREGAKVVEGRAPEEI